MPLAGRLKGTVTPRLTGKPLGHAPIELPQPRVCPACERSLPMVDFQRLPSDDRCVRCVEAAERDHARKFNEEQVKRTAAELLDAVDTNTGRPAPSLDDVLATLMDEFGGYRQFVHEWANQIKIAHEKFPGRAANLQHLSQIARLVGAKDRVKVDRDVAEMTDEQLRAEYELELMRLISEEIGGTSQQTLIKLLCVRQGIDPAELIPSLRTAEEAKPAIAPPPATGEATQ